MVSYSFAVVLSLVFFFRGGEFETIYNRTRILIYFNRLRIHARQEWSDLYHPENVDDLHKFFDYFVKGIKNDWLSTPRVRGSLVGFNLVSFNRSILKLELEH